MLKVLLVLGCAYIVLVGFVYLNQAGMLYLRDLPGRTLEATPDVLNLDYEDVVLETSDGMSIHGWFVPGPSSRVLLYFHGNAGNISHRLHSIRQFNELGLSVFIIDYRGYGKSSGSPSEDGLYLDAEAAWNYLTGERNVAAERIIAFGRSLGGSVAARIAARHTPAALIVESSFTSVPEIAQEVYPWLPARLLSRFKHATREYVAQSVAPLLVVHSRDDEIIPFHHGESIFEAARGPKSFLEIRGGHNDAHVTSAQRYRDGLREFLDTL